MAPVRDRRRASTRPTRAGATDQPGFRRSIRQVEQQLKRRAGGRSNAVKTDGIRATSSDKTMSSSISPQLSTRGNDSVSSLWRAGHPRLGGRHTTDPPETFSQRSNWGPHAEDEKVALRVHRYELRNLSDPTSSTPQPPSTAHKQTIQ